MNSKNSAAENAPPARKAPKSRFSLVDKIFRWQDRFSVNDLQHPKDVLADIKNGV
jgi:hypothetical protein